MATLLHARSGDTYTLHSENLVGRKSKCDICLHNRQVSGAHAELRWTEQGWVIHDLDSRNGTYVNHRRLERGERLAIEAGAIVAFADSEDRFKLVDDSPPAAHAVSAGGQICESSGRIFVLPDTGPYECTVYERNSGWYVEERDSGASRPVTDGEVLTVGSEPWTLHLPVIVDSTWNPAPPVRFSVTSHCAFRSASMKSISP
ncbi:MAG: FHA domain-containing protein [Proteobacteria bacterium]|nr:FHA domain-containing protein [Pseudomonadota bacterium]